jgi:phosphatidylserine/phosphatidylglycerophosphate/cardiolipin synthase-like enzyme
MHHKFVIEFDKPVARVCFGSYNFSGPADDDNGENLLLIADRGVATSCASEAVRLFFDHYEFRLKSKTQPRRRRNSPYRSRRSELIMTITTSNTNDLTVPRSTTILPLRRR